MIIKILTIVPVAKEVRPKIGEEYEVIKIERRDRNNIVYFIKVNNKEVGILPHECIITKEDKD